MAPDPNPQNKRNQYPRPAANFSNAASGSSTSTSKAVISRTTASVSFEPNGLAR
jgi:hypothetical protein